MKKHIDVELNKLKEAIKKYEIFRGTLNEFDRKRFLDGWFSWDDDESSEYDIWNDGRKTRERAENKR